jgi:hypothetical protein
METGVMTLLLLIFFSSLYAEDPCKTGPASVVREGSRYRIELEPYHQFKGTDSNLHKVWIYTKNKRFADYLTKCPDRPVDWIENYTKHFDCIDMFEPRLFLRYERRLGRHLRYRYWKKTKRWVPVPDVLAHLRIELPVRCVLP